MAGKWGNWETDFLELILENTNVGYFGAGGGITGSVVAGDLYVALFTGSPAEDQSGVAGNECTYTGYDRVTIAREGASWTIANGVATNAIAITFGTDSSGSETATYFGICKAGTKTVSDLLWYGLFTGGGLAITVGVTPQIQAGDLSITCD